MRVWSWRTRIVPIIPGDSRRKDGGYDRNFTNTANGRVSIAISRLTDLRILLAVLDDRLTLWSASDVVSQDVRNGRWMGGLPPGWRWKRLVPVGEFVMLNAAQRNRRYRALRTLQLTKQITLNQRTPIPASVHGTWQFHWLSATPHVIPWGNSKQHASCVDLSCGQLASSLV